MPRKTPKKKARNKIWQKYLSALVTAEKTPVPWQTTSKKKTEEAVVTNTPQVVEEAPLTDDLELIAVISAAIAASEGTSTDSFVVRSIHRR